MTTIGFAAIPLPTSLKRLPCSLLIGRHFKQPAEGLGNDNTAITHMWRTIADPDRPV